MLMGYHMGESPGFLIYTTPWKPSLQLNTTISFKYLLYRKCMDEKEQMLFKQILRICIWIWSFLVLLNRKQEKTRENVHMILPSYETFVNTNEYTIHCLKG
jgi:hypothetical protein